MARIRSIHPSALSSERLAELTSDAERLFWRLLPHCDDQGRADDSPKLIAAFVAPLIDAFDAELVDRLLDELACAGLIERYQVGGSRYLAVMQWRRFQRPRKPQAPTRPASPTQRAELELELEANAERERVDAERERDTSATPGRNECSDSAAVDNSVGSTGADECGTGAELVREGIGKGVGEGIGVGTGVGGGESTREGEGAKAPRPRRPRLARWNGDAPATQGARSVADRPLW
jgi:hypothetical protein